METLLLISILILLNVVAGGFTYLVARYYVIEEEGVGMYTRGVVAGLLITLVIYTIQLNIEILKLI